jgi:hypothetical protein
LTNNTVKYTSLRIADPDILGQKQNLDISECKNDKYFLGTTGHATTPQMNTTKIQKFIEKQKKRQADKRNKEQNEEHEKALKVQQNLLNLHNYTIKDRLKIKDSFQSQSRQQSHQLNIKKI